MNRTDQQILFTALGFLAVILKDEPRDNQAAHAKSIARLMEQFCAEVLLETVTRLQSENSHPAKTRQLLEEYIAELRDTGSANLSHDRQTLLDMYEILLVQKIWHEQREFFANGHEDMIANRILQLAEERIEWEGKQ